jgi:hypothetical protein
MVLTRQEKEKKILDLYNQGKTFKQIAVEARVSLRDINPVLKKAEKEREKELAEYQTLNEIQDQIDRSEKMLEWLEISRQEEEANIDKLEQEQIRLKRLVKRLKDNSEEYLKIKNTVKQLVSSILFDGKRLLHLSLTSLMESMRTDPHRYSKMIYYNGNSSARNNIDWQYTKYNLIHRQQPYPSFDGFYDEYESTLLKEAEKLYNKLVEEWTEQIINEYSIKNDSTHNKLLRPDKGRQQQQFCYKPSNRLSLPMSISDKQAGRVRGVKRIFVRTGF